MISTAPPVYSRLFLPHPLLPAQVGAFLTRIAAEHDGHPLILETRADASGIQHLIGCEPTAVHSIRRLLTDLIPGSQMTGLDGYARTSMLAAGRITVQPPGLPLAVDAPEAVLRGVYSALARTFKAGEAVCIQLVLGSGVAPRTVPAKIDEPGGMGIWQALTAGKKNASAETRNRVRDRASGYRLDCALRIGVAAGSADKRRRMARQLASAMAVAQSPGVEIGLIREHPNLLNMSPVPRRWATRLAIPELVALSAWPVSVNSLPGMPPIHPKVLRAESSVHTGSRVFARSLAPGDDRRLGVSSADSLFHGIAIGPTGSGKTSALQHLMEADIAAGHAVVVVDPKDQIPDSLLRRIPRERWADVVEIDASAEHPHGFNPLDATGRDPDVVADSILSVFSKIFEDGWGPRTADIFSASLRTLARTGTAEHPNTLLDLPRLWTDASYRRSQVGAIQDDVALAGFWSWYESLAPPAQANVIAAPMNKLRQVLLRPAAVRILGQRKPTFALRNVFRERKIVIVPLNEGRIGPLTAQLIGSLVISEVWQATQERAAEKHHQKHPGFVYVDEADRFLNLPVSLADALARSRSLSVGWSLAIQYWDQLSREMKAAVKTNARTKIVFQVESDEDARTTAKLAPELTPLDFMSLGKHEVYTRLVANGATTGWALAKTLPPSRAFSRPSEVRAASRKAHALTAPTHDEHAPQTELAAPPLIPPPLSTSGRAGRVRRAP